jgi:hypothetical protein
MTPKLLNCLVDVVEGIFVHMIYIYIYILFNFMNIRLANTRMCCKLIYIYINLQHILVLANLIFMKLNNQGKCLRYYTFYYNFSINLRGNLYFIKLSVYVNCDVVSNCVST